MNRLVHILYIISSPGPSLKCIAMCILTLGSALFAPFHLTLHVFVVRLHVQAESEIADGVFVSAENLRGERRYIVHML